jgi:hypothetical protein
VAAHNETAKAYLQLLQLLGIPYGSPLALGLAVGTLARLASRGRVSLDELEKGLQAARAARSAMRILEAVRRGRIGAP